MVQYKSKFGYLGMPLSEQIFRYVGYFADFSWFIAEEFFSVHFSYITRNALQILSVVAPFCKKVNVTCCMFPIKF